MLELLSFAAQHVAAGRGMPELPWSSERAEVPPDQRRSSRGARSDVRLYPDPTQTGYKLTVKCRRRGAAPSPAALRHSVMVARLAFSVSMVGFNSTGTSGIASTLSNNRFSAGISGVTNPAAILR